MENPIISVIVPIYNVEKYIDRCITSLVNQTLKDIEIILVDDGSTDTSPSLCDKWATMDQRIKVIHKENGGASSARNIGIENAIGRYIAFVDSDDYIELNMYKEMMEINRKYDCDIVMCDCYKEDKMEKKVFTHNIREGYYDKKMLIEEYFSTLLMTNSVDYPPTISNCTCLFKRELIIQNKIRYKEDMRFSEDWLFGSQAMYFANSFYYMKNKCFYHYIMNSTSVTHTYYKDKWIMMKQLFLAINDFFENVKDYDFHRQIDISLLFIVYHCIGNIKNSNRTKREHQKDIQYILNDNEVIRMFKRIKIKSLNISWKLRIITYIYKLRILPLTVLF